MKVLLANKFFYLKGGAEMTFFETARLLQEHGHRICFFSMEHPQNQPSRFSKYFVSNVDFEDGRSLFDRLKILGRMLYSFEAQRKIARLVKDENVDVAHFNSIYHQISPSIIHTLNKRNIPIIMTLHDYKLVCPAYTLMTKGKVCEKCINRRYYWCFINRCTKGSYVKSALNSVEMYLHHRLLHIYELVDVFIAPSQFLKEKIEEMDFKGKIVYLPNTLNLNKFLPSYNYKEKTVYYAGRLSEEKGLHTLIEAVKGLDVKLKVIGDGPIRNELEKSKGHNTYFMGYMSQEELKRQAKKCMAMVIPSEWYENNPRSVIEAFALGKPVIGARIGGIPELVQDGQTGFTFQPGDADDLREKVKQLISMPSSQVRAMGEAARTFVEENFNQAGHYQGVMEIYHIAMQKYS